MPASKLLVIVPCYKEAKNLAKHLDAVCKFVQKLDVKTDLLIVEGNKLDDSSKIVKAHQKKYSFLKFVSTHNGKGHQVKTGLEFGEYQQYLFMDADLATPLKYIPIFLKKAKSQKGLGMITGIRTKRHGNALRKTISMVLNSLLRVILGFKQTDTQCGFKLLSKDLRDIVIQKQTNQKWIFDIEYFIAAHKNGFSVIAIPIPDWENDYERDTLNSTSKFLKSSFAAGIELLSIIWRSWTGWYKVR